MPDPRQDDFEFEYELSWRTGERLYEFLIAVYDTLEKLGKIDFSDDQQKMAGQINKQVIALEEKSHLVATLYTEMESSIKTLIQQRQTSKAAFKAGWEGFYYDLLSRLDEEERARLRPIFDELNGEKEDDDIPF